MPGRNVHLCPGLNTTTIFTIFCLGINFTKIAIFRNYRNFHNFRKIRNSCWVFQPQIWPLIHLATNLSKIAIFRNSLIFVKFAVLVESFNKFQLADITNITWISFILKLSVAWDDEGSIRTANFTKITTITNFRSFRKFPGRVQFWAYLEMWR